VGSIPSGRILSENAVFIGKKGFYLVHFHLTHVNWFFPKLRHFDLKNGNKWQQ
jgi:hypothetical protein